MKVVCRRPADAARAQVWLVGTLSSGCPIAAGGDPPRSAPGNLTVSPARYSRYVGDDGRESCEKREEGGEGGGRLGEGGGSGGGGVRP